MTPRVRTLMIISLAIIIDMAVVAISHSQAANDTDKAQVMATFQDLMAAWNHKDAVAVMALYSDDPDAVFFEDPIPLQFNKAALREPTAAFFESVSDFHARADSVDVRVSGDLAVVHCIVRNGWTDKSGQHSQTSRDTEFFRKEGSKWLIWHEHYSVPFDPATARRY
jgi:PhnB protein